jgi:hypothetical protein
MGSGPSQVVFNSRERIVSPDFNRLQRFGSYALAQMLYRMHGQRVVAPAIVAPGLKLDIDAASGAYPVWHKIAGGLMVRCDASDHLLVDPGSAMFWSSSYSSSSDDSDWIFIDDPGVTSSLALPFVANAGPGIRLDVVECKPTETVTELESRDIYDVATETFTPSLVNKVSVGRLTYRIRQGTAGAGIPANDPDWCPLAVVVVSSTATAFTECDLYDVRPLISPAVLAPATETMYSYPFSATDLANFPIDPRTNVMAARKNTTNLFANGWFGSSFRGYRIGGALFKSAPPATWVASDVEYVDLADSTNYSASVPPTLSGNTRNCLACLLPPNFFRFVRYSRTTTGYSLVSRRIPYGSNGVYTVCSGGGDATYGAGMSALMPATTGVTAACTGPVVAEVLTGNGKLLGFRAIGNSVQFATTGYVDADTTSVQALTVTPTLSGNALTYEFPLSPDPTLAFSSYGAPVDAVTITADILLTSAFTSSDAGKIYISDAYVCTGTTATPLPRNKIPIEVPMTWATMPFGGGSATYKVRIKFPMLRETTTLRMTLVVGYPTTQVSGSSGTLQIIGYER